VADALYEADLPVVIINPKTVRNFTKALGFLAKTDKLDAKILALYAQKIQPQVRPLKDAEQLDLTNLVTPRRQLRDMITREENRRGPALPECGATSNSPWPTWANSSPTWTGRSGTLSAAAPCGMRK
jgi:transposase